MALANVRNILRVMGRLCSDPTSVATAFPHGGTALGLVRDGIFRPGVKHHAVLAEEWGNQQVEVVYGGEMSVFAVVLRELDNDMVQKAFVNTAAGTSSGDRVITYEPDATAANTRPGTLLSTKSFKLLFSPKATNRDPAILIYKAIPVIDESAELQLSLGEELGIAALFHCIPDASGRVYQVGKLEDLTL